MTEQIIENNENINQTQESNLIKVNEIAEDFSNIQIEQYLPSLIKISIINKILEFCISINENELKTINYSWLEIFKDIYLISNYSNLDIDEFEFKELFNIYDQLNEKGISKYIIDKIPQSEIIFINWVLDKEIEQIQLVDNGVSSILAKTLNTLIEKIPDQKSLAKLIKDLPKQINKLDPNKLKYVSEAIGWNNGVKKEG